MTPPSHPTAQTDAQACQALLAQGSKSFALAGRLLPGTYAQDATALYAFCRVADDLIDDSGDPQGAYRTLCARLDAITAAVAVGDSATHALPHTVDRALARTMARHAMPRGPIDALLDGFLWDATDRRYETFEDTLAYAARVAGSVGVAMAWLMGQRDPGVLARAADLGVAMQLTNIARDVAEDARRSRVYLPATWLREQGLTPEDVMLDAQDHTHLQTRIAPLVLRLLDEADVLYARGRSGLGALPWGCRAGIDAAARIYRDIGRVLRQLAPQVLARRAVVPTGRKIYLLACALFNPWGRRTRPALLREAALPCNEFLLTPQALGATGACAPQATP